MSPSLYRPCVRRSLVGNSQDPFAPLDVHAYRSADAHEPLVSYQINRQLSGWNLPPLVMRAFGALCQIPT
jgi:hypothetical protein